MKDTIKYISLLTALFFHWGLTASAQPAWNVNSGDYTYSMTITGKVTTDGYYSTDENDMVAAFIDGECRGVAHIKYENALDACFIFLMVYSNDPVGTVTFKIYDSSADKEIDAKETINFTVNDIVGSVSNPFTFSSSTLSSEAEIISFSIPDQEGETIINGNNIYLQENWSGDLKSIAASFVLSEGAKAFVNGTEQQSGITINDFVTPVDYTIESADHSTTTVYTVHITTANDLPTDIQISDNQHEENSDLTFIGKFTVETADPNEVHQFELIDPVKTDDEFFYIQGSGLRVRKPFNFEEKSEYRIKVRADDGKGGVVEKYFTIQVTDENDAPSNIVFINVHTPVNASAETMLAELATVDEDKQDSHRYMLVKGDGLNDADNAKFYIEGNQLKNSINLSFFNETEYRILVESKDSGGESIIIPLVLSTHNNGNPPHNITLSNTLVVGIEAPPLFVGTLQATDVDQKTGHLFTLPNNAEQGPDNTCFNIQNNNLYLNSPEPVAQKNSYEIYITATDSMGNKFGRAFLIKVNEKLGDGNFFLTNDRLPENKPFNTIVGYFDSELYQSSDYSFNLPLEVDLDKYCNDQFKLIGRTLLTNKTFDFELEESVMIQIEVSDGETEINQDIALNVINQNDPPAGINVSTIIISESAQLNSAVAILEASDQDLGDIHEFSLIVGNGINDEGNKYFKISDGNLILTKSLNYENQEFHNILLRVTDQEGAAFEQGIRLKVADANDAPEFTQSPVNYVLQNQVYVYSVETIDSEGDPVTISFEDLPEWLSYNESTGLLTGIASNDFIGDYSFSVIANDGKEETILPVIISVLNVNDSPEINYFIDRQHFIAEKNNILQLPSDCITDPDKNDNLIFNLSSENNSALPEWLHFNPELMELSGTPKETDVGFYHLKITAKDNANLKAWMVFELEVSLTTPVNSINNAEAFSCYPNPFKNILFVKFPAQTGPTRINVLSMSGETIKSIQSVGETIAEIPFNDMEQGVYLIQLVQEKCQQIQKIVKY